jgi:hypothetical protein
MSLVDKYKSEKPITAQANLTGGDKTLIEADGGLDLSVNEKALKKARNGEIGQRYGWTRDKNYSSIPRE